MNEENDYHRSLLNLLKMFKDRPNHLTKYLIENSAFNDVFLEKLSNNNKLKNDDVLKPEYFKNISKMNDYYNSLTDDIVLKDKTIKELTIELNIRLLKLIYEEKYEEAAKLRDYMSRNNIKREKK